MSKAVISIIKGGLGNQLFIYSAGRAFALRTQRDFYIDVRRGFTHDNYGRSYRLDMFPIEAKIMPEAWRVAPTLKHIRHKIVRAWNKILPRNYRSYLAQRWDLTHEQLTALRPRRQRVLLNGYWPDENFFSDYSETIRKELQPPAPTDERNLLLGKELSDGNTVFIHARRLRYPILLSPGYYSEALQGIREKVSNPKFVVFSDDPAWTRENIDFGNDPVIWVEHNSTNEIADLWLMSQCRHAVIANSTFSWWGAWLGGDSGEGRVIYTPDHPEWFIRPAKGWNCIPFKM